jgi:hypothetical protein
MRILRSDQICLFGNIESKSKVKFLAAVNTKMAVEGMHSTTSSP